MKMAKIIGTGSYVPEKILTNADLEKIVDTSDEWIRTRTGMQERHISDEKTPTSELAYRAALKALESASIDAKNIDFIILATVTPDMILPSTACIVQNKLKANKIAAVDIEAACSGFLYGMSIARQYILSGEYKNILVIGAEELTKVTNWQDRNTCILFGDGSGAAVISGSDDDSGILSTHMWADGNLADLIKLPAGGSLHPASKETVEQKMHYIQMSGSEVFKSAVRIMEEGIRVALEKAKMSVKDIDILIPHQANIRIIQAIGKRLEIPNEKVFLNIEKYGNTSAASIAIALDEAVRTGRIKKGNVVALVAFGSGLTMSASIIRW